MSKRQATFCFIFFVVHSAMSAQTPFKKIANQPLVAINSIDSDDFADLKFLDTLVQNKRVVFLGESSHYVADFNILKFRLIRYLHQQHGFEVVVFESGIDDCGWSNIMKDSLTDIEMLAGSVKGIWRTRENLPLMNYIRLNHMELAGMDAVGGGYFIIYQNKLIKTLPDPSLFVKLFKIDSVYGREYIRPVMRNARPDSRLDSMAAILGNEYRHLNAEIVKKPKDQQNLLLRRTVDTRLLSMTSPDNWNYTKITGGEFREQQMADNLRFLLDTLYPGKKVIVWAHNGHISKIAQGPNKAESIPSHLPERIMLQSYVLGLCAFDGE
ncbi:MAG TPA: erythromycin esterase family protein, partial [Cyclobacteriaceae bacterium]|nr:erythromycin esterase family protein [Cyclobacteriaceae bacterium]